MATYAAKFSDGTEHIETTDKSGKTPPITHAWAVKISVEGEEGRKVSTGFCTSEADAEEERGKCLASIKFKGPITFIVNEVVPVEAMGVQEAEEKPAPATHEKPDHTKPTIKTDHK